MRIIHIFDKSIFLIHYLSFLDKYYDTQCHTIITNSVDPDDVEPNHNWYNTRINILEIPRCYKNIFSTINNIYKRYGVIKQGDLLIYHSISDIIPLLFFRRHLSKSVWVIFGADLYDYRTRKKSYGSLIHFIIKKSIVKKIPYVVARTPDFHLLQEWYGSTATLYNIEPLYGGEHIVAAVPHQRNNTDIVNITLGNSATDTNRHLEALDILSKFKDENIRLYITLSYGNKEYARRIKEKAISIFGEKVIILSDFMSLDEYNHHLSQMDIGIFNNNRQQALGNIAYLLVAGAKIYLNSDCSLWEVFDEYKFKIHDISKVQNMEFREFANFDEDELEYNSTHAKEFYSEANSVEGWSKIFELAKKK